jgi:hypothetical protein
VLPGVEAPLLTHLFVPCSLQLCLGVGDGVEHGRVLGQEVAERLGEGFRLHVVKGAKLAVRLRKTVPSEGPSISGWRSPIAVIADILGSGLGLQVGSEKGT